MLVLSRRTNQTINLGTSDGPIVITICRITSNKVRVGVDAPQEINIKRGELKDDTRLLWNGTDVCGLASDTITEVPQRNNDTP